MGEIVVEIELENSRDRTRFEDGYRQESEIRRVRIPAVADTGAMMLALPADTVDRLALEQRDTISVRYADDRRESLPVAGPLNIRIGQHSMATDCIVLPAGSNPVVGQIVTRVLDLLAGRTSLKFNPRPESPDRPLVRL